MVNVKDAAVLLHGVVLQVEQQFAYDEATKRPSDVPDGLKVMLSSAGGIAVVKMNQRWVAAGFAPSLGSMFAAVCSPYAYAREQGLGNMGYSFLRHATVDDLEQINAHLEPAREAAGASAS